MVFDVLYYCDSISLLHHYSKPIIDESQVRRMENTSCELCSNLNCFIKKYCSLEWIHKISNHKYHIIFKQNQVIINEGEPVLGVYFIQKGKVKVYSNDNEGRQLIVRYTNDGHLLGHRGVGNEKYPISAVALEDSTLCFILNEKLNDLFLNNPKFTVAIMMYYSRELRKTEARMKNIAHMNLRQKVAEAIMVIIEMYGLNQENELNVEISRKDIADTIGTNVEQVSRQLSEFVQDGLIEKRGRKIMILDKDGIENINYRQII